MTEYTPKTIEILETYQLRRYAEWGVKHNKSSFEFDRWLAQVKADAIAEFIRENIKEIRKKND
jgi:hypothetical protein